MSYRSTPSARGFATTTYSRICSGWSCAGRCPKKCRRCTGGPPDWFTRHGQVVDAIGHTQAAGDWPGAARLLADHSFSLMLDGQAQTIQALLRAFPPGVRITPSWP